MRARDSWRDCERAVSHVTCTTSIRAVDAFQLTPSSLPPATPPPFVVSVVCSSSFRTFVLRLVMYRTHTHCHLTTYDDWSVHMPSAWGRQVRWRAVAIGDCASGSARDVDARGSARWLDLKAGRRQASRRQAPRPGAAEDPGKTPGTSVDPHRERRFPHCKKRAWWRTMLASEVDG